jgi:hypothetical protein
MVLGSEGIKSMLNICQDICSHAYVLAIWLVNPASGKNCDLHKLNLHCLESFVVKRK